MRARFWRNVTLVAIAHVAALIALFRWAGETKAASAAEITWLGGSAEADAQEEQSTPLTSESTPEPVESPPAKESEIVLPSVPPIPTPAPIPTPRATPKKWKATPTPETKAKKKPSATPATKKSEAATKKKSGTSKNGGAKSTDARTAKTSTGASGDRSSGTGSGKSDAAKANYYGNMLHDRFYGAWQQPQTVVASGVKLSAVARIRIEKDGRVSDFKIVRPSGNVLVDESVTAAGKKVTQVDALPSAMGTGGHYDVNINFALNSN